ncbi:hypothetical protein [Streptomyces sp. NPDC046887]|uniref:hypothetical protein n=1 Tax=Streptomyces sp. NPDC046887 TaxID=3155472 RepID=UPI0033FCE28B
MALSLTLLGTAAGISHASTGPQNPPARTTALHATAAAVQSPVPQDVVRRYNLDTRWYTKYVAGPTDPQTGLPLPVLGSARIQDATLLKAARQLDTLTRTYPYHPIGELNRRKVRVVLTARSEKMSSIPEVRARYGTSLDERYWAGMGATDSLPLSVGTEANLVDNQGGENCYAHEFGHSVADMALTHIDPDFQRQLDAALANARAKGLWRNTYAQTNYHEYWAEGLQSYFDINRAGPAGGDGVHNDIDTRSELQRYDAQLFTLLDRVYRGAKLPS